MKSCRRIGGRLPADSTHQPDLEYLLIAMAAALRLCLPYRSRFTFVVGHIRRMNPTLSRQAFASKETYERYRPGFAHQHGKKGEKRDYGGLGWLCALGWDWSNPITLSAVQSAVPVCIALSAMYTFVLYSISKQFFFKKTIVLKLVIKPGLFYAFLFTKTRTM